MLNDFTLNASDKLTLLIKSKGITSWKEAIYYIKTIPYGRNANRKDVSLVLTEGKGSCSSKHALLKKIADTNKIPAVDLILGMYKMNSQNTPKIGTTLAEQQIDYIPEAHCYLKIGGKRYDFTNNSSDFSKIKNDILNEIKITPEQVSTDKINYHKQFLKDWIRNEHLPYTFENVWKIRENCIQKLSEY